MEYYNLTETFDTLFQQSKEGNSFEKLYELIISRQNILLAYRTIKSNKGSTTPGIDGKTIEDYAKLSEDELISSLRKTLENYKPMSVRRKLIPNDNGDFRPLGIPTMRDRLIQQMFKQVLEPICEAKFYNHSYGFRPLKGASHAKARVEVLVNVSKLHYCVDVDIKGFFDNVNHNMLKKQLWNIGIKDRKVLAIIMKMLKAPIKGIGIPTKGTPQGGILSPLLANVCLHDLDKWVYSQWEGFKSRKNHKYPSDKYRELKEKSNLKEGYIIRYADDFKIMARDVKSAYKWFHAVKLYLKDRLKLDISPEKSKVINLRKNHSEFLGFTIKAIKKKKKHIAMSKIRGKKKKAIKKKAKILIKNIAVLPNKGNIGRWNSFVLGLHNYFKSASRVTHEFGELKEHLRVFMYHKFRLIGQFGKPINPSETYVKFYKGYNYQTWKIKNTYLFPLPAIKNEVNRCFSQDLTIYSESGRMKVLKALDNKVNIELRKMMETQNNVASIEYNDNRLSRYSMKKGKCEITGTFLYAQEVHCHHYLPRYLGGTDEFNNLRIIHKSIHELIHSTKIETQLPIIKEFKLTSKQIELVNKYRKMCNLEIIDFELTQVS